MDRTIVLGALNIVYSLHIPRYILEGGSFSVEKEKGQTKIQAERRGQIVMIQVAYVFTVRMDRVSNLKR